MKILKTIFVPLAILPLNNLVSAQKKDSIPKNVVAFITDKFPQTRDLNVEFTQLMPYKFSPQLRSENLPENKIKNFQQINASTNIYFIKGQKWMLSSNLNYKFTHINPENEISIFPGQQYREQDFHYHSESLSLTHFSKVFNKLAVFSATASVDGSDQHFERFRGMLTASVVLKATANTKMSVGLALMIDPSIQIPVLPVFTYEHTFSNEWVADIILPRKILMRKNIFQSGRLSLGAELNDSSFYLYPDENRYEYRQIEINSGAAYEHTLGENLIGTLKIGLRAAPRSRIFEKRETFNNFIFEANTKPALYFNIGISYNPFTKLKNN
ncbi:hypothetical protein GCM10022217_21040 [Chryseobacterium ginsenosidimutans]|uniref:DUF6268 family outer membrane beta-barrel protein n=1 Tax=Chryseobacterium ginsenosidimutans TaxID=687846 RepID=UPI0031D3F677